MKKLILGLVLGLCSVAFADTLYVPIFYFKGVSYKFKELKNYERVLRYENLSKNKYYIDDGTLSYMNKNGKIVITSMFQIVKE